MTRPSTLVHVPGIPGNVLMTPIEYRPEDRRWHTSLWRGDFRLNRDLWGATEWDCLEIAREQANSHTVRPQAVFVTQDQVQTMINAQRQSYMPMYGFTFIPFALGVLSIILAAIAINTH